MQRATETEGAVGTPAGDSPSWPQPLSVEALANLLSQVAASGDAPGAPPEELGAARRIWNGLARVEREALERAGPRSPFADALVVRLALEVATVQGLRLFKSSSPPAVDEASFAALNGFADAVSKELLKRSDAAVSAGAIEEIQLVTAAAAALERDLRAFRDVGDRLRSLRAQRRRGGSALDPAVSLPESAPVPPQAAQEAPPRPKLADFANLEDATPRAKKFALGVAIALAAVALLHGLFLALPRRRALPPAGGVTSIAASGDAAVVVIDARFAQDADSTPKLLDALRARGVERAMLQFEDGTSAGAIDVKRGSKIVAPSATSTPNATPTPDANR